MKIDLHAHTSASDGTQGPRELVQAAARQGLDVLGVTDHDTVASLAAAAAEGAAAGVRIIPGIELTAQTEDEDVHVLGYFLDPAAGGLDALLDTLRRDRRERVVRIVEALGRAGVHIPVEEVFAEAPGDSVTRAHVARILVRRGLVRSSGQAFRHYLGRQGRAYVPGNALTPRDAIDRLHACGAVAVLAHPGWLRDDAVIPSFVAEGLDGIEAYYPDARGSESERYLGIARRFRLLVTGGSDYHGLPQRGTELGSICCPEEDFRKLEEKHREWAAARKP